MAKGTLEATKELIRLILFFLISALFTGVIAKFKEMPQTEITIFLSAVLRWLDKYFYTVSKKNKKLNLPAKLFSLDFL